MRCGRARSVAVILREVGSHVQAEGGRARVGKIGPHGRVAAPGREDREHPLTPPLLLRGAVDVDGRGGATLRHLNGDVQLGPEEVQGRPALRKEACTKVRRRLRFVPNAASAAPERLRAHATVDVAHDPCVDSGAARAPAMRQGALGCYVEDTAPDARPLVDLKREV